MYNSKKVSVIFPAYNEEENIAPAIEDFFATGIVDEIVVVDNNSSDRTAEEVLATKARLVKERRQGYGYALQRGLKEATGELVIMSEPDGTFSGKDVFKLLSYSEDFEFVLGTRTTKEMIWEDANMDYFLRFGNIFVAKLLEVLFDGPSLSDCGCTMRLIRRGALNKVINSLTVGRSHFLPEMVILALLNKIPVIEIPVNYRKRIGVSKITGSFRKAFFTGVNMIALILKYRLKSFFKRSFHAK
ncbi:MAG: glycosyltransferase family 2 protein [Candidatus Omnitrophota bacterium]